MKKVVVFLDFDGVLHPLMGGLLQFVDLPNFEAKIRENKNRFDFNIVISSTWKKNYTLSQIRKFFSPDIALLISDVTPSFPSGDGSRYNEALDWLAKNDMSSAWIAIDDDHYAWNRVSNLVWCHDKFQEREMEIFQQLLEQV